MLQLSHISIHVIIIFSFQFSYNFFNIHFFKIFTLFLTSLHILPFIFPLLSTLISLFIFPFIFLYFVYSYSHPFTINLSFFSSILCKVLFLHKKKNYLSLSLSHNFLVDFLYFSCISALG